MPRSQIKGGLLTLDLPLCGGGSHAFHSLYIKDHATAAGGGKTNALFVGNIDYNASRMSHRDIDAYLRELFSPLGEVTSVSISSLDSGEDDDGEEQHAYISSSSSGSSSSSSSSLKSVTSQPSRFAHVQFAKSSAVKAILQAIKNGYFHEQAQQIGSRYGLGPQMAEKSHAELREAYALVDTDRDALKRKVDSFMRDFEKEEALARYDIDILSHHKSRLALTLPFASPPDLFTPDDPQAAAREAIAGGGRRRLYARAAPQKAQASRRWWPQRWQQWNKCDSPAALWQEESSPAASRHGLHHFILCCC